MKDNVLLVACAIAAAAGAWVFWGLLGNNGFYALLLLAFVGVFADNVRLRRQLKRRK